MDWNYGDISSEDIFKLIKGWVDMLILASGYQSSGLPAHWDVNNTKIALHWSLFFQNVFNHLCDSTVYSEKVKEIDAALKQLTSNPSFPQGLLPLSSVTLGRAKEFVMKHLTRGLPLRDSHFKALMKAVVEMDRNLISQTDDRCLDVYLHKLTLLETRVTVMQPLRCDNEFRGDDFTKLAVQGILTRQSAVSCVSTVKTGLDVVSSVLTRSNLTETDNSFMEENMNRDGMGNLEVPVDIITWNRWKAKNLSYFLNLRTVRLVSGASMILSAPKIQWEQLFQRLHIPKRGSNDILSEILELLLLGCIADRWTCVIEHFTVVYYDSLTISKQYHELCKGKSQCFDSKEDIINSKENCILEYLTGFLSGQLHQLWKLSPALIAASVPSWSPLFRSYLSELETQFKGKSSTLRYCSCSEDGKEHKDCELAERIWCLYIFHISGSYQMRGASGAKSD